MEVKVRRDGSLIVKFDGDGIAMGLRVLFEGEDKEEKIGSAMALFRRVNQRGSVIATAYQLRDGEFKPVRRTRSGRLVPDNKKNWAFITREELLEWIQNCSREAQEIFREAALRMTSQRAA